MELSLKGSLFGVGVQLCHGLYHRAEVGCRDLGIPTRDGFQDSIMDKDVLVLCVCVCVLFM